MRILRQTRSELLLHDPATARGSAGALCAVLGLGPLALAASRGPTPALLAAGAALVAAGALVIASRRRAWHRLDRDRGTLTIETRDRRGTRWRATYPLADVADVALDPPARPAWVLRDGRRVPWPAQHGESARAARSCVDAARAFLRREAGVLAAMP
ncbi:MAG TPA: hypothetical protein VFY16_01030 [Gemmatimonadaceae bacterium]|nr:hypothetical protein [Gemmatimonadaceae bacterium]